MSSRLPWLGVCSGWVVDLVRYGSVTKLCRSVVRSRFIVGVRVIITTDYKFIQLIVSIYHEGRDLRASRLRSQAAIDTSR